MPAACAAIKASGFLAGLFAGRADDGVARVAMLARIARAFLEFAVGRADNGAIAGADMQVESLIGGEHWSISTLRVIARYRARRTRSVARNQSALDDKCAQAFGMPLARDMFCSFAVFYSDNETSHAI